MCSKEYQFCLAYAYAAQINKQIKYKMSVSIYNSYHCDKDFGMLRFTTESKMHHQQQQHSATSAATVPRAKLDHVRRNLFGPVDRKECSR